MPVLAETIGKTRPRPYSFGSPVNSRQPFQFDDLGCRSLAVEAERFGAAMLPSTEVLSSARRERTLVEGHRRASYFEVKHFQLSTSQSRRADKRFELSNSTTKTVVLGMIELSAFYDFGRGDRQKCNALSLPNCSTASSRSDLSRLRKTTGRTP